MPRNLCQVPDNRLIEGFKRAIAMRAAPPVRGDREAQETIAAGAIIDVMTGGKLDWRARIDESDFLESADWQQALLYARAAILSLPSAPVSDKRRLEISRLETEGWKQASVVSGYWIKNAPDNEFVNVCNGDLRKLNEATHEIAAAPVSERDAVIEELLRASTRMRDILTADGDPPSIFIPNDIVDAGDANKFTQVFDDLATTIRACNSRPIKDEDSGRVCDCDPACVNCPCTCERAVHEEGS